MYSAPPTFTVTREVFQDPAANALISDLSQQIDQSPFRAVVWLGRHGVRDNYFAPDLASALRISVLWMLLSLAMTRAEMIVETQKLFFGTNEEVVMPVSYSGAAINYRVKNYSGGVVLQGQQAGTELELGLFDPGYYTLELTDANDTDFTSFVVMTPITANTAWPFGAQTHFAQFHDPDLLPALKAAGIGHIRDEQYWGSLEEQRGVFTYPQKFVDYMGAAQANGIQPLIVLTWSNPFYDYDQGDLTFPYSESGRAGFVNYTRNLVQRWGTQIKEVELWNEPGGNFFLGPATANRPEYYTLLLKQVYPAVKQLRSDVKVVAGATFPIQQGFFRELFEREALAFMDAASIHPYGVIDALPLQVEELRNLMRQFGPVKPIWVTEHSYSPLDNSAAEQKKAAIELAQQVTLMLSIGIERMYYYLAQDDGIFPVRGLLGEPDLEAGSFRPHPTFAAYATVIRQLGGKAFEGRVPTSLSIYAMRFQNTLALWSRFPATVALPGSGTLSAVDIVGAPLTLNRAALELGPEPIYISGNVTGITELINPVVADSTSGVAKTQGANGWSYGYTDLGSGDPYTPANFRPMQWQIWRSDDYRWVAPGRDSPFAEYNGMHPAGGTWAIRRWESNFSGVVTLTGHIGLSEGGDGVGIRIFVDGYEVYSRLLNPDESTEYSVPNIQVTVGSKVDFAVTAFGNADSDQTLHTSTILRQSNDQPNPPRNLGIQ